MPHYKAMLTLRTPYYCSTVDLLLTVLLVFFLWLVKSLKNLQIIWLLITWRNVAFFSDFQYGFSSSGSTAELLTAVSARTARTFNRYGATWATAFNISRALNHVLPGFLAKSGLLKTIFSSKKCSVYNFLFYKYLLQTHASRVSGLTFSTNICSYWLN